MKRCVWSLLYRDLAEGGETRVDRGGGGESKVEGGAAVAVRGSNVD